MKNGYLSILLYLLNTRTAYCDQDGKLQGPHLPAAIPVAENELQALLDLAAGTPIFEDLTDLGEVEVEENTKSEYPQRFAIKFKERDEAGLVHYLVEHNLYSNQASVIVALLNTFLKLARQ